MQYCEWLLAGALGALIVWAIVWCRRGGEGYTSARRAAAQPLPQGSFLIENHQTLGLDHYSVDAFRQAILAEVDQKIQTAKEEAARERSNAINTEREQVNTKISEAETRVKQHVARDFVEANKWHHIKNAFGKGPEFHVYRTIWSEQLHSTQNNAGHNMFKFIRVTDPGRP